MTLTYATAPQHALRRAMLDVGERWWDDISLEEQNSRVAHHLQRLLRIIDDAHKTRLRIARETAKQQPVDNSRPEGLLCRRRMETGAPDAGNRPADHRFGGERWPVSA